MGHTDQLQGRWWKKKQPDIKDEEVEEPEPIDDICTCNECGSKACVNCDRPWHEGETCREYKARVKDRFDEEDLTMREIKKVTRKCPSCSKNIIKHGGCPSMFCKYSMLLCRILVTNAPQQALSAIPPSAGRV